MKITLRGEPKSTNHIYKYACRGNHPCMYMTADGKALKEAYQWEARSQFRGDPLTAALSVTVRLFYATKRKADWDNAHKLWQDALTGIVWEDDSQIVEAHVFKGYDKENPRIEITVDTVHSEAPTH